MQQNWRQNHPRNSHQPFHENQRQQRQPHRIFDPVPNDLAVQEIFQFVNDDEVNQRDDGVLWRPGEGDADNHRIAEEVPDNRQQSGEKREHDNQPGRGQAGPKHEYRGDGGVDAGNQDLCSNHGGKTFVKCSKTPEDRARRRRVKIGIAALLAEDRKTGHKQRRGHHQPDDEERELLGGDFREISKRLELRFGLFDREGFQAVEIVEGQGDIVFFRELEHSRNGFFGDLGKHLDGLFEKINEAAKDSADDEKENDDCQPAMIFEIQFGQREVGKKDHEQRRRQMQQSRADEHHGDEQKRKPVNFSQGMHKSFGAMDSSGGADCKK
jgi:hypothetical protein